MFSNRDVLDSNLYSQTIDLKKKKLIENTRTKLTLAIKLMDKILFYFLKTPKIDIKKYPKFNIKCQQ